MPSLLATEWYSSMARLRSAPDSLLFDALAAAMSLWFASAQEASSSMAEFTWGEGEAPTQAHTVSNNFLITHRRPARLWRNSPGGEGEGEAATQAHTVSNNFLIRHRRPARLWQNSFGGSVKPPHRHTIQVFRTFT